MKIGLSVSLCISDMIAGRVALDDVACLIGSTRAVTPEDWEELIASYSRTYWVDDPAQAVAYLVALRDSGRLVQPRTNGQPPPWCLRGSCWLDLPTGA
jgi:hypothetical protein